jgi:hypothetical protein
MDDGFNNIYHEIIIKLNTISNFKNIDFSHIALLIIEIVEDMTENKIIGSEDKLELATNAMEYCLTKLDIDRIDKIYIKEMFPIMTDSLISISNKKYKLHKKPTMERDDEMIIKDTYDHIKIMTTSPQEFTNNFFKIILIMIDRVNNYKDISNIEKKNIIVRILNCIINNIEDFFSTYDEYIDKIIFYNKFTSSYIDNVFKVYKNKSKLNIHKQFFKATPFFK